MPGDLGLALVTGLLGGFGHCAAMCGPLVAMVGLRAAPGAGARAALGPQLLYNAGRVTTYALAGAVLGAAGSVVELGARTAGLQGAVQVAAGVLMALLGLGTAGLLPWAKRLEGALGGGLFGLVRRLAPGGGRGSALAAGLVFGLLPCGLSWSAFIAAAATGSALRGGLWALAFGLGTAPALLVVGSAAALLSAGARGLLHRAGGVLVALVGLLFVLRGLGIAPW